MPKYKWIQWEEPDTVQQLACSWNVTMDVTLTVTEERSGSVYACSQRLCLSALSPLWHTRLMKSDYMHMESVSPSNVMQLCNLCMPLVCTLFRLKKQQASFRTVHLSIRLFNDYFVKSMFFCFFIAGSWKYNWQGMWFLLDHICLYLWKKIYINMFLEF